MFISDLTEHFLSLFSVRDSEKQVSQIKGMGVIQVYTVIQVRKNKAWLIYQYGKIDRLSLL